MVGFINRLDTAEERRSWKISQKKIFKLKVKLQKDRKFREEHNGYLEYSTKMSNKYVIGVLEADKRVNWAETIVENIEIKNVKKTE